MILERVLGRCYVGGGVTLSFAFLRVQSLLGKLWLAGAVAGVEGGLTLLPTVRTITAYNGSWCRPWSWSRVSSRAEFLMPSTSHSFNPSSTKSEIQSCTVITKLKKVVSDIRALIRPH